MNEQLAIPASTNFEQANIDTVDDADTQQKTVLVIGAGPAGIRFCHELLKQQPQRKVILFGDEAVLPYNRVLLSSLLAGEIQPDALLNPLPDTKQFPGFEFVVARIKEIHAKKRELVSTSGERYHYHKLVIATGSNAHKPDIPGIEMRGVYTFRDMKDTEYLYSRCARSRHVVIVGGGLLGIEAARALQRANTQITLVQQSRRLMNRQLDDTAAQLLQSKIEALGIRVITQSGVRAILGRERVEGVKLYLGGELECDTVLVCAGVKPNVQLAQHAQLKVMRGIVVDDQLRTSNKHIYAIGECSEHRGQTYGLISPGLEQAAAAANRIAGNKAMQYHGSQAISRLKVLNEQVCSMGEVSDLEFRSRRFEWVFQQKKQGIYRKIVVHKGHLTGVLCIGAWDDLTRVQEAWQNQRRIYPWQILRFLLFGELWTGENDVNHWPASAIVCQCNLVSQGEIRQHIQQGCTSLEKISQSCKAGSTCGSCKPLLVSMLQDASPDASTAGLKERFWPAMLICSALALLFVGFLLAFPPLSVSDSVQQPTAFENIWNDKFWKQVTGFSLLGMSVIGLLMSLRKRLSSKIIHYLGQYSIWRLAHLILGLACVVLLFFHTGLHFGSNLNFMLMLTFVSTLALGAATGLSLALGHLLPTNFSQGLRRFWTWAHIVIVWPLPILVGMHILSVYYF